MSPERFFELMLAELEHQPSMHAYYKFLGAASSFEFRKNYFLKRLHYIWKHLQGAHEASILDVGCGYGTTCLFLAMNGIRTHGTTLEFYYQLIEERKAYWAPYGDVSLFSCSYENLYDTPPAPLSCDWIVVQDTLHHLEPIGDALHIFHKALKPGGRILAIEENGSNIIQRAKLYKYRGNKRIISVWDEHLQKQITMGNENIRPLAAWKALMAGNHFEVDDASVYYVRYYLPFWYKRRDAQAIATAEDALQAKPSAKREYFFFGLNFIAEKKA